MWIKPNLIVVEVDVATALLCVSHCLWLLTLADVKQWDVDSVAGWLDLVGSKDLVDTFRGASSAALLASRCLSHHPLGSRSQHDFFPSSPCMP